MFRISQVEKIKTAVREYEKACIRGVVEEIARHYAVLNAIHRNSSAEEIDAAIRS